MTSKDGRPASLGDLIVALSGLNALGEIDKARAIPGLIEAAKTVLSRERAAAMAAATAPGGLTRAELARQLGISRSKVTEAIAAGAGRQVVPAPRAASAPENAEAADGKPGRLATRKAAGLARIRISIPRPGSRAGEILAVWDDDSENCVGTAVRTEATPGSARGWRADLRVADRSLAEGHVTWRPSAKELAKSLTESAKAIGPWWD